MKGMKRQTDVFLKHVQIFLSDFDLLWDNKEEMAA
jgi:hypothetical protein